MVVSRALMNLTQAAMSDWIENHWLRGTNSSSERDGGDVAIGCFLKQTLNITGTRLKGMAWGHILDPRVRVLRDRTTRDWHDEVIDWHYVKKSQFLSADIFFGLNHIDRLERNGQIQYLAKYARELVLERYHLQKRSLRRILGLNVIQ